ncbi:hypothetical protein E1L24_21230 [Salmonella enterica subsp. enterica serovar Braenderup]|nr:hypothetical protein [Salmonella enterica subsp. enterica serovar Braenderup]
MYKVRGDHFIRPNLGLLEYATDGDFYKDKLVRTLMRFRCMRVPFPTTIETTDEATRYINTAISELSKACNFPGNKRELKELDSYLKRLNDEYRQWEFNSMMETSYTEDMIEDMRPLLEIYELCKIQGGSSWDVLREHAIEILRDSILEIYENDCLPAIQLFRTAHKRGIESLCLNLSLHDNLGTVSGVYVTFHLDITVLRSDNV